MEALNIYKRSDKVNFMNTGTTQNPVFTRMQGFTTGAKNLNSKTYTRQYIDEDFERETTTGYSPNIAYNFDRIVDNAVHEKLVEVHEEEQKGATVEILTVDLLDNSAKLRTYSVNPDTDGDGTDAYTYSGNFHADSPITKGTASVSSDGLTATFTPDASI